ncbi:putative leucine-rich repeat-containing, plant-type, leucine-rich repeat domain superfamily [Helianthus annuus]|nr:putative leucine-rich repeat-containing, plant-type, leucine-rich repeat domain superfamily [Helianthus annuus]
MMHVLISLLLCILFTSIGLLTLGLKEADANMSFCIEKERQALLDFKANINDSRGLLYDWGSQKELDCCKWVGVGCNNHTGHVIELDITFYVVVDPYRVFNGKISPSLLVLTQLQYLNLNYIDFQLNPLPSFLGSLSNLQHLHISLANLSGPIPHQLANLSNLLHLDLSGNHFQGSIPFSFGEWTSLIYLNLSQNQLRGAIPKTFGNCSSLVELDLSQNLLNGSLPKFIGCSSLTTLSLAYNSLHGSMTDFKGCTSLKKLDISSNFVSGNMSNSEGQLSNLEYLDVSHNSLNGSMPDFTIWHSLLFLDLSNNQVSGNVPDSLGQVTNLRFLDLSSNSLEGVITEVHFLNLTQLRYLDLSFNSLALDLSINGRIPFQLSTIKLQSCKVGPRFPEWLKTQENFTHLDISNAGISDGVPDWFWDLPVELEFLNISSNEIEGTLPNMTCSFNGYPGMDFSNNHFRGRVPLVSFSLAALNLSRNKFSGTLSFICNLDKTLTFLDLSNNSLSGSLPDCWMKFQKTLVVLNLSYNNLFGDIPSSLGFLSNIEALYLRANKFVGEVPMSLSNNKRLRFVDLGENKLSGVIPEWIGEELSELYVLVLGSNRFYGSLPSQICWLYNLQLLDLSDNGLSGDIPRCFDNFTSMARESVGDDITSHSYSSFVGIIPCDPHRPCPYGPHVEAQFLDNAWVAWKGTERSFGKSGLQLLKSIDLSRNNLSGKVSYEITGLYELVSLNVSFNKLHGEVPKDIGLLRHLESLDLSNNEFSGHIPWSLAQLNFLSYLDLSYNNLSGRIPAGSQLQRFNYTSYSGNPQLCGPPLTPTCGFPPPPATDVGKKDVEQDEDDYWKSYYIGMGTGFGVGFWGICGLLILNRRCRYFFFASLSYIQDWIYVIAVVHFGKSLESLDLS